MDGEDTVAHIWEEFLKVRFSRITDGSTFSTGTADDHRCI